MARFAKYFVLLSVFASDFFASAGANRGSRESSCGGERSCSESCGHYPRNFSSGTGFFSRTRECSRCNSATQRGVHFADDLYVLAGMVDSSGYSTAIKEKYQAYLLNEVTTGNRRPDLKPGAYGNRFPQRREICSEDRRANTALGMRTEP